MSAKEPEGLVRPIHVHVLRVPRTLAPHVSIMWFAVGFMLRGSGEGLQEVLCDVWGRGVSFGWSRIWLFVGVGFGSLIEGSGINH